jgi:hypothetical protein
MRSQLKIYGRSDDLIEVVGAVREEFYAKYGEPSYIEVGDDYLFKVEYSTGGVWRIEVVKTPNGVNHEHTPAEETDSYSDVVLVSNVDDGTEVSMRD